MAEVAEDGLLGLLLLLFTVVVPTPELFALAGLGEGFLDLGFSAIEVILYIYLYYLYISII